MRRHLMLPILVAVLLGMASPAMPQDYAQSQIIDTYGATCFMYRGYAYVPLRSAVDFLGATLTWYQGNATVDYRGSNLILVMGSVSAQFAGSPVRLPVPPVDVDGVAMTPALILDEYLDVDIHWAPEENRLYLLGPPGWGYFNVLPNTPADALAALQGYAPPPPSPGPVFVYSGITYVPLLDWCDFLGIPLFFEPDFDDFTCIYGGTQIVLFVGERRCFFGPRAILLPAAPIIVGNRVCVPQAFFVDTPIGARIERVGQNIRLRGVTGFEQFRVDPRPPAAISTSLPRQPQRLGVAFRPPTVRGITTPVPESVRPRPRLAVTPPTVRGRPTPQPAIPAPPSAAPKGRPTPRFGPPAAPPAQGVRPTPRFGQPAPQPGKQAPKFGQPSPPGKPSGPSSFQKQMPAPKGPPVEFPQGPAGKGAPGPPSGGGGPRFGGGGGAPPSGGGGPGFGGGGGGAPRFGRRDPGVAAKAGKSKAATSAKPKATASAKSKASTSGKSKATTSSTSNAKHTRKSKAKASE